MKHILQALDRVMEAGEVAPARFNIIEALERVAPGVVRKPVSVAPPPAPVRPVITPPPAKASVPVIVIAPREDDDARPLRGAALQRAIEDLHGAQPDREPWPASWFLGLDPFDVYRCQQLWGEALRMLLIDAADTVVKDFDRREAWDTTPEKLRRGQRPDVRVQWVGSADFLQVCALAGLDGAAVGERVLRHLATRDGAVSFGHALSISQGSGKTRRSFRDGGDE